MLRAHDPPCGLGIRKSVGDVLQRGLISAGPWFLGDRSLSRICVICRGRSASLSDRLTIALLHLCGGFFDLASCGVWRRVSRQTQAGRRQTLSDKKRGLLRLKEKKKMRVLLGRGEKAKKKWGKRQKVVLWNTTSLLDLCPSRLALRLFLDREKHKVPSP